MPPPTNAVDPILYSAVKPEPSSETAKRPRDDGTKAGAVLEAWNRYWIYEIGACLLSLIFLIGIVVILKKYDHQRLPDWPYGLTINTMVSALATALGVTLAVPLSEGLGQLKWQWFRRPRTISDMETFDSATRGPVGALKMLFKLRGLHLGTLGCVVTIISLAISPFVQQVVSYQTRATVISSNATIPKSNRFDVLGPGSDNLVFTVNSTTQAAVFNGIFNPDNTSIQVQSNCLTGNCSFSEPYSSLAVCSSCSNVTDYIDETITNMDNPQGRTYSLPNGASISDFGGSWINTTASTNGNNTVWSGFGVPLNVVSVISSTNDAFNDPGFGTIIGPWAAQCVLYFCVNTYTSTVVSGNLEEQTVSTYFNESAQFNVSSYDLTPQPCLTDLELGNSTYNASGDQLSTCAFTVPGQVFQALPPWLAQVLNDDIINFPLVLYNNNHSSFEWVVIVMSRLAKSLTSNIRTYGDGNPAFGVSSTPETYILVEWKWLILPACVVLLSIFFLLLTIIQNRGMESWKTSSLALLFAADVRDEQDSGVGELHGIEWIAKGRAAVLRRGQGGNILLEREIE